MNNKSINETEDSENSQLKISKIKGNDLLKQEEEKNKTIIKKHFKRCSCFTSLQLLIIISVSNLIVNIALIIFIICNKNIITFYKKANNAIDLFEDMYHKNNYYTRNENPDTNKGYKITAVNYADVKYLKTQRLNTLSAIVKGKVDEVYSLGPSDIDHNFYTKNKEILDARRGAGFWLWKPYIIKKILSEKVEYGDYLMYADSGSYYIEDTKYFVDLMKTYDLDILPFVISPYEYYSEKKYTKRDAFILMECDSPEYTDTPQIMATYAVFRKSNFTLTFLDEWITYGEDRRIISDDPNVMGKKNYEGFYDSRHDQTIFSLLVKKHKLKFFRDPSNWGLNSPDYINETIRNQTYPLMIISHKTNHDCSYFGLDFCDS